MKNKFCLFLVALFIINSYAQDSIQNTQYQTFYYPSGLISSEGYLRDGKPDGFWKSYFQNGILASQGNRKNFLLDSIWTFYNEKGEKTAEISYKNGKKSGKKIIFSSNEYVIENWNQDTLLNPITTYYIDGKIKKYTPIEDGKPHGIEKLYSENGLISTIATYYHGVLIRREQINRIDNFNFKQGNWKGFWDNGNLRWEGYFINDKKNGFFKYYDENGNFVSVEKWENDQLIEDAPETKTLTQKTAYHNNGKPSITATYYKNIPEGIRREFDTSGNIIKGYLFEKGKIRYEGITDLNGLRQGIWKEYYETGELRSTGKYYNSIPIGEWKFFFKDKKIEIVGAYNKKGKRDGEWNWYYPNGELLIQENWSDGTLDGEYTEYDENQKELTKGNYVEGAEEGEWYYRNNQYVEIGSYYDGMRIGTWTISFPNGKPAYIINYEQDLYHGNYTSYWENGNIHITGKYENGTPIGAWKKYDEEGNISLTTIYKDGKEIQWNNYNFENRKDNK